MIEEIKGEKPSVRWTKHEDSYLNAGVQLSKEVLDEAEEVLKSTIEIFELYCGLHGEQAKLLQECQKSSEKLEQELKQCRNEEINLAQPEIPEQKPQENKDEETLSNLLFLYSLPPMN